MSSNKTPVVFYWEPQSRKVLAVFPFEAPSPQSPVYMGCFQQNEGHGSLDAKYLRQCRLATPEQYRGEADFLESCYEYDLEILPRMPRNAGIIRFKEWKRVMSLPRI